MKFGVSSQNFRTITGHAGKGRRFMVFELGADGEPVEVERLDLPLEMSIHAWHGQGQHPLFALDYLITAGAGEGFQRRLAQHGVQVRVTSETDPKTAVKLLVAGRLPAPSLAAQDHQHDPKQTAPICGCGGH